ncbi:hypothetical protein SARC_00516 [Sphaeroforma arctica JP610]|uniref:HotDog ACOT-type domain-containing protein n=1 Tax=Sphaeroforma arctica JP610 TaxID=667725 RepID=A0A0L0GED2_9EUKA|nr:hypothetical protein SARC_00516 [Sphaeroforma arctica JP610]KNC87375.1 hypothetical protein SARC_00516 [Sphaeroforma arctica JP610]|eukprot:XP_014161277.1 hypothetical protein SARC_00516 [Sphaeroforma arctica JP610]
MDVILSGQVSSVGRTSLEVCIEISTADSAKDLILECFFVMAARDKAGKGVELPKLELNADMQRKSAERKAKRKQEAHDVSETMKNGLTAAEFQLLHEYITSAGKKYKSSTPMKDTELSAVKITEPQQRNTNNRIFGGYLMREAFEVAHAVAIEFAGPSARPFCMSVDEITFIKPVEIGSLVKFKGKVVYTGISKKAMQVKVKTYIHNLNTLERYTSNEFRFTFASEVPLPTVIPSTFVEGMNFLDGRRSHRRCKQLAKEQKSALQDNY